ncbi:MAG: acyl carrier protein [Blastocatellia bacterium]
MSAIQADALSQIKAWLLARTQAFTDIDMDLDIIENRIVDSLSLMEFLFFLEKVSGRDLASYAQSANSFRTLRLIRDNILEGAQV